MNLMTQVLNDHSIFSRQFVSGGRLLLIALATCQPKSHHGEPSPNMTVAEEIRRTVTLEMIAELRYSITVSWQEITGVILHV